MLVLSRKPGEWLTIGEGPDAIKVCVVDIRGDKVWLGIEAPRSVNISRPDAKNKEVKQR